MEIYVLYEPSTGQIKGSGRIDRGRDNSNRDGSTVLESIERQISAGAQVIYLPDGDLPDTTDKEIRDGKLVVKDPLPLLKRKRNVEIKQLRDRMLFTSEAYTFSDGAGTIQTRDNDDMRNLAANASAAQAFIVAGRGDEKDLMKFRDEENAIHLMTPRQMLSMCMYVMDKKQKTYTASWTHQDAVKALATIEVVKNYDITQGW